MGGISGSTHAVVQARFGVMRFGASRFNYFSPNFILTVNGTARTSSIRKRSVKVTQNLNDGLDTAEFTVKPNTFTPTEGQSVIIALGHVDGYRDFGGQIVRVKHLRRRGNEAPWLQVECTDWSRSFNRRRVQTYYENQSATDIIQAIVATYTSGFTTNNVQAGLASVDLLPCELDTPMEAIARVMRIVGGGFYIDPFKDVHAFPSTGETGARAPTPPVTLTNSLSTMKMFAHERDVSQLRTRDILQTKGTRTVADAAAGHRAMAIEDGSNLSVSPATIFVQPIGVVSYDVLIATANYLATAVRTGAAVGATSLEVNDLTLVGPLGPFGTPGIVRIGQRYLYYTDAAYTVAPAGNLTGIPTSGIGSILTAIAVGEVVETIPQVTLSAALPRTIPNGTTVTPIQTVEDAAAQAVVAAAEGGDGIHEFLIRDEQFDATSAPDVGATDLAAFKSALVTADWETEDLNARVGAQQVINLTVTDALSTTLTITTVDVEYREGPTDLPRRHCQASVVRLATAQDVTVTDQGV